MKTINLITVLAAIAAVVLLSGCESEHDPFAPTTDLVEEVTLELSVGLTVAPPQVLIGNEVTADGEIEGGELPYKSIELSINGVVKHNTPDGKLLVEQLGVNVVTLTVVDAVDSTRTVTFPVTGTFTEPDTTETVALSANGFSTEDNRNYDFQTTLVVVSSNGVWPHTYSWTDPIGSPAGTTAAISATIETVGTGNWSCVVTDAAGTEVIVEVTTTRLPNGEEPVPDPMTVETFITTRGSIEPTTADMFADVDNTLDYDIAWSYDGIVFSTEASASYPNLYAGEHSFNLTVVNNETGEEQERTLTVTVDSTPIEQIPPFTLDGDVGPQDLIEPVTASGWIDIDHGSGRFQIDWGLTEDHGFSHETTFDYEHPLYAGEHPFIVRVEDLETGQVEERTYVVNVLPAPGTTTESFEFETDLWVGPNQDHDTDTHTTGASDGRYYTQMKFRMDVSLSDASYVIVGIKDSDDVWTFLDIPDPFTPRPSVYWVDTGEIRIEPQAEIHLWFESDTHNKCDGTDRLLVVKGSREVPADKSGMAQAELLSEPPAWIADLLGI